MSLTAMATDYKDTLVVTLNGQTTYTSAIISLASQNNGTYTLSLNNFIFKYNGTTTNLGTITFADCKAKETDRGLLLEENVKTTIEAGNISGLRWKGPSYGELAFAMRASLVGNKLQAVIDFILPDSPQKIFNLHFGEGYQLFNGSFETFKNANGVVVEEEGTYAEPEYWHSFNTASGELVSMAGKAPYLSSETRPGSTGTKSLLLKSTPVKIFGITMAVANGTITTGRLNAGDTNASSTKNHAEMDLSKTDKDPSGHPFYSLLNAQPDSIVTWVKFKQQSVNNQYPYATISATITDGTYYQEPVDKTYTNIVGRAENNQIASNGAVWQRLSVPFDYESYTGNNVETKAIMVTMSTNNGAGTGKEGDELYVDDVELVYNADITSVKFDGNNVEATQVVTEEIPQEANIFTAEMEVSKDVTAEDFVVETNAKQPFVGVEVVNAEGIDFENPELQKEADQIAFITCYAADLSKASKWIVFIKKAGINYDLNGDGKVSTADIQVIINEMKKPSDSQDMSYDLNGDGKISTADIQVIINEMKK